MIILHHYPESLFSEKVRLLLGHLGLAWRSVVISNVMPRPLLMPLSGGYRKTPILQIGANVFCDTRVIARALARAAGDSSLYDAAFAATRTAEWADSTLFQITVALNFRPDAVGAMLGRLSADQIAAFQKDRAELSGGAQIASLPAAAAQGALREALVDLETTLERSAHVCGERPSIADFSVYHCLWFLNNNPVNARLLEPYRAVTGWMRRMAAIGHGTHEPLSAEAALEHGRDETPHLPDIGFAPLPGFALNDAVRVTPTDYGRIPVAGSLAAWSEHEIVIRREDPLVGAVMVHFPATGFEVAKS